MKSKQETVRPQAPLLIDRIILTQGEIRNRLFTLFPRFKVDLSPIIHPVAEEVERILLEITSPLPRKGKYVLIAVERYRTSGSTRIRTTGYSCPVCACYRIQYDFHFCPQCGTHIEWNDAQKSRAKEGMPTRHFANIRKTRGNLYGGENQVYNSHT